jgi:hypothetical protein
VKGIRMQDEHVTQSAGQGGRGEEIRRWRFHVLSFDDVGATLDADGGPEGDCEEAEFVGTSMDAMLEADRRCNLWESNTGRIAARITRESFGLCTQAETK